MIITDLGTKNNNNNNNNSQNITISAKHTPLKKLKHKACYDTQIIVVQCSLGFYVHVRSCLFSYDN